MRRRSILEFAAGVPLVGLLSSAPAGAATVLPSGVVYVQTNARAGGANAVLAYRRDSAGRLSTLPGSPFRTGGTGFGDPQAGAGAFDSDQNVMIDRVRRLLFTVNGGSNTVAVFRIGPTGALTPVPGSPFPSGGRNPVGVGLRGDRLIVVNKDADLRQPTSGRPSYVALRIRSDGGLQPLANSTVTLPENASPTQPLTTNAGRFFFGCQFRGAGPIDVLSLGAGGLVRVGGVPVPVHGSVTSDQNRMPLGMWAHPTSRVLYVGLPNVSRLAVFSWDTNGRLTFLRSVASAGSAICWLIGNRSGSRLYGSDTGSREISVYDTSNAANPVEIQTVTLKGTGLPFQLTLSPDGGWLYVVAQRVSNARPTSANALHVLRVASNGRLTEVASSPTVLPIATGDRPQGVAAL